MYTLHEIKNILMSIRRSLTECEGMPIPDTSLMNFQENKVSCEELKYNIVKMSEDHNQLYQNLDEYQKVAYHTIVRLAREK